MSNLPSTVPSTTTFRDLSDAISPTWLKGPVGSRYRYAMHIQYDTLYDAFTYALRSRFPDLAPDDAIQFLALDRVISRGPNEPLPGYIARLIQWLDLYRHDGSATAILLGYVAYFSPTPPKVLTVLSAGDGSLSAWDTYEAGAGPFPPGQTNPTPPDHDIEAPANWRWDGLAAPFYYPWMRWRTWVVIFSIAGAPFPTPTVEWSNTASGYPYSSVLGSSGAVLGGMILGGTPLPAAVRWGDGTCWGWGGNQYDAPGLRGIATEWKTAGSWIPWIIVSYDATMFDQTQAFGSAKLPDSTWGRWGKKVTDPVYGSVYVPSRPPANVCSFIVGTTAENPGAW